MRRPLLIGVVIPLLLAPTGFAQSKDAESAPTGTTLGVKLEAGYMPNLWIETRFTGIPETLRTVHYSDGSTYTFSQDQLRARTWLTPFKAGPSLDFGNRIEISGGGAIAANLARSTRMQLGCYCVGSTVTYIEIRRSRVLFGGFADMSVRLKGTAWLAVDASSYPIWRSLSLRHGFSEFGGDQTLFQAPIGSYRAPLILLAGPKFCLDCDSDGRVAGGIRGGFGFWQNRINPNIMGMQSPHSQRAFMIEAFIEGNFFKKKTH